MACGGIMLTSCREPPRQFKHLRVLIVEENGEYGTGDCNAKMADWLFEEFGQQGHRFRAGQFRLLAEREDESGMIVVGKRTIKRMDHQDVDERGQPYDLILPESSLKGTAPARTSTSGTPPTWASTPGASDAGSVFPTNNSHIPIIA
jgi:hypothetical protein